MRRRRHPLDPATLRQRRSARSAPPTLCATASRRAHRRAERTPLQPLNDFDDGKPLPRRRTTTPEAIKVLELIGAVIVRVSMPMSRWTVDVHDDLLR